LQKKWRPWPKYGNGNLTSKTNNTVRLGGLTVKFYPVNRVVRKI
jgi:hypothetical protein